METITRVTGNKQVYSVGLPLLIIQGHLNDVALAHIAENTGLHFAHTGMGYQARPTSSLQIVSLFLTYNFKTRYFNNTTFENTLMLRNDHHVGFDVTSICFGCCQHNHVRANGLKKGDRLAC